MTKPDPKPETEAPAAGVLGKLRAHKNAKRGERDTTLPETGIRVTWPAFLNHGTWQKAMRRNKGNVAAAQTDYMTQICRFDGEKITVADWEEFIPLGDANELLAAVFAGSDTEEADDEAAGAAGKLN